MNIVYFDVETKHLADEVGGWDYIERFGLAVAVTYSTRRGTFAHYTEQTVNGLIDDLLDADLVVGLGHRVVLVGCCGGGLVGAAKSGDGTLAVQWFRQGQLQKVIDYCKQDVDIVRRLHEHGRNHRHILIADPFSGLIRVPVDW